ncbi:TetR family transcriptional regulator [Rhodococcus sp. BP-149]|uniref:TetR/AcrR family transcriptional regulator n=1 Tax=unclassified Rhodococcus (in: high G+C Gram-positive bacteria) TaxID=192944 RepID=UPI001C9B2AAC|nr:MULTISPECIES: TetR/AcrR family transcriptional regulator [unclassified Rhodococcus (in: high G+C Gram-positive bacteria)]MBY6687797.1 TetR family transcriptional regulator [Rhodococcus sp. BP-288]MBY6696062.1 TetR family transcriptional regulator [Rhodococcus sp. BP-188]MBY6700659.1 TetR family transcriptional regulator [Rhodococcus sp. BP-285]MBY6705056.1 TetR family transcriptional regulator [Rhodococcus sp. BP-283]MBY6713784.1 TetR family transcriptional regulator [Rhodococcus sp. BP-160
MSGTEPDPPRRRRRRGSLTAERVLEAAFALAEEQGLASFTMPDLASRLEVGVTGLYWHYRTKDDLIKAMSMPAVARLERLMVRPTHEDPQLWRAFLRRYFEQLRAVYNQNPILADIMLLRPAPHDDDAVSFAYGALDRILEYLVGAGFTPSSAWYIFSTATHFTQSTVIAERSRTHNGEPLAGLRETGDLRQRGWASLATLVAGSGVELDMTGDRAFRAGMDLILGGAHPG